MAMVVVLEGIVHRFRHLQLARAVFVAADHAFFEEAAGPKMAAMVGCVPCSCCCVEGAAASRSASG